MDISTKGLIEIMSLEGVCLSPYLDSVGVWTIGVGVTKYDGKDPRDIGEITIEQAITLFKDRIKAYASPVQKSNLNLSQNQFDALVSFCYNCGEGNLHKLIKNRSVSHIGEALMLYTIPKEITARRQKEQNLFKNGTYTSNNKVLVFPVSATHKPVYSKGYVLDVTKYFSDAPIPHQTIVPKAEKPAEPVKTEAAPQPAPILVNAPEAPASGSGLVSVWEWLRKH